MKPRKRRVWTVGDFAAHAGLSHGRALRLLKRLDDKHRGAVLIPSAGSNRSYTLFPATLARLEPDLFAPIESLEFRVEALEESADGMKLDQRRIVLQVGQNTRDIARIRSYARAG
jgi:hypothetical protein